jgi:hypothetical protein
MGLRLRVLRNELLDVMAEEQVSRSRGWWLWGCWTGLSGGSCSCVLPSWSSTGVYMAAHQHLCRGNRACKKTTCTPGIGTLSADHSVTA